jgi:hypothetical protein
MQAVAVVGSWGRSARRVEIPLWKTAAMETKPERTLLHLLLAVSS